MVGGVGDLYNRFVRFTPFLEPLAKMEFVSYND